MSYLKFVITLYNTLVYNFILKKKFFNRLPFLYEAREKLALQSKGKRTNRVVKTSCCQLTFQGAPGATELDERTPCNGPIQGQPEKPHFGFI